tara:strand:- start:2871 stop:3491 length:621 start_codon:yes stop_codon:yes gene_type:complete
MVAHRLDFPVYGGMELPEILEFHEPHVDEIILSDTSPDGVVSEATKDLYPGKLHVSRYPGELEPPDLGAFRNHTLEQAQYSWVMVLDPDETVRDWGVVRDVVNKDPSEQYYLKGHRMLTPWEKLLVGTSGMARLFKNGHGYHFINPVCEILFADRNREQGVELECGWIHHTNMDLPGKRSWHRPDQDTHYIPPLFSRESVNTASWR